MRNKLSDMGCRSFFICLNYLVLYSIVCVFCSISVHGNTSSPKTLFYIYDWPHLVDRYANFSDRPHHSHGVEMPNWRTNFGAGRLVSKNTSEYKTSQFSLFKLMYERALIDPRRTLDPSTATSFFIPYDFGMDATFFETNGRMRKTNCPLATEVQTLLQQSMYFQKNGGHDHFMISAVNQNMNYFFGAKNCLDFLMKCWNCTKLSIDEYMFIAQDRKFELKNRGINWHAVPFPSDFHYDDRIDAMAKAHDPAQFPSTNSSNLSYPHHPWELSDSDDNRFRLISFLGNPRKFSPVSTSVREALLAQCNNYSTHCTHGVYSFDLKIVSPNFESRHSTFCLQPPGDMPTRKSVFDVILAGCIPVLFHPLTARFMYEWHLGKKGWEEISINYDSIEENRALIDQKENFVEKLIALQGSEIVKRKRQLLREQAFSLQYSLIYIDEHGQKKASEKMVHGVRQLDAYDTSMEKVLAIHSGLLPHDRHDPYIYCMQIKGGGSKQMLQTAEWCNVSNTADEDPFHPAATISIFQKKT